MVLKLIGALIASYGFGYLYNVKGKKLVYVAFGGLIGAIIYSLLKFLGITELMALLFSSIIISFYAEVMAKTLKTPVTAFILIALIILVPGGGMYYTMLYASNGAVNLSIAELIDTLAKAGALALGAIIFSGIKNFIVRK